MSEPRPEIEQLVRSACERRDFDDAATVAVREYGPEILGVLAARLRSQSDASEVFSQFCEDFWRGLPDFRWQCSVRVWAYTLSRHAAVRYLKAAHRRPGRNVPLSQHPAFEQVVQDVRTTTAAHLKTENRSRMQKLREQLSDADQELLILRVDKQMSFREIAIVVAEQAPGGDAGALERAAARLRKRFQLAKDKLRRLAERDGLV